MPIKIALATSPAVSPKTTGLNLPRDERPAVRANRTVRPSERLMMLI